MQAGLGARQHMHRIIRRPLAQPARMQGRRLGLRHRVGQRIERRQVGQRDRAARRAAFAEHGAGGRQRRDGRRRPVAGQRLGRHADAQPRGAVRQFGRIVGHRIAARGRVARIVAGDDPRQQRAILRGARQRADRVERPGARHRAVPADPRMGRLEPDHAADPGGQPHRAAGVRAERAEHQAGRDRGARAARRAAGDMRRIPRVAAMAPMRVMTARAGGEFRHVEPAERDRAGGREPLEHGRGVGGDQLAENLGAARGCRAAAREHVLVGQRHAVQRPARYATRQRRVGARSGVERRLGLERDEGVDARLPSRDARQAGAHDLDRRDLPGGDRRHGPGQ